MQIYSDSDNEEEDLASCLNMLCLENDDMEYVDDSHCLSSSEMDLSKMVPKANIPDDIKQKFLNFINEKKHIFASTVDQLGCCKGVEFEIETSSEIPIHSTPYRQPPAIAKQLEEEVMLLLQSGIIRKLFDLDQSNNFNNF